MTEEFENPIDEDKVTENPHNLPYAHHVGSAQIKPVDKGRVRSRALVAMEEQTDNQLKQIKEQIDLLAKQAKDIQDRVEVSYMIYDADIGFEPLVGHIYHLYQKDGSHVLSMIGPGEWKSEMPFDEHVASARMMADHTWEVLPKM